MIRFAFLLVSLLFAASASRADDRLFELRTYYANEGKLEALHSRFRDHTISLFTKHGMSNVGYWVPKDNPDRRLVYLMAYPNIEKRNAMWDAFLNDPVWKKAYADSTADGKLVSEVDNLFLKTTDYSPELKIENTKPNRLFELRVYTTNEGKLENLNARFRDHTVELFTKHGLNNLTYFVPAEGQPEEGLQLVYFLTHKDEASRGAGFKAFSQDPKWKTARAESEKDGKILLPKGVASTLLLPTDYSPLK